MNLKISRIPKKDTVWVQYSSKKENVRDKWIKDVIVQLHEHCMEVSRLKYFKPLAGPTMKPAYEDMRITSKSDLANVLIECSLEALMRNSMDDGEINTRHAVGTCPLNVNYLLSAQVPAERISNILDIRTAALKGPQGAGEILSRCTLLDIRKQPYELAAPTQQF